MERTKPLPLGYLLAVILIQVLASISFLEALEQQSASNNQQLVAQHHGGSSSSAGNQLMMFKDLSGPTSGKIQTLDVICGKNFMTVRAEFSAPFYGIVFSKGTYGQENCIYVKPNSGLTHAAFNVYYDQCGTKPDLQGKFYENTIVIQYGSDIIEAYDEAKRLRCEWFEAYEKPATFKPAIPVADLEVVEMNFQGDDIDCWMEIQEGAGPSSREVSKIVSVGQPMTIVVAINDYNGIFDMRVKSCVAHDGVQQPIALTDEFGCVLRPKMLTPFQKIKNPQSDKKATILSYSRFLAFKFPDSMTVQIQCTVEVCRHGCADACQKIPSIAATTLQPELSLVAKWPAAPNQPALASSQRIAARPREFGPEADFAANQGQDYQRPAGQVAQNFERRPPSESIALPLPASGDDMSGSESQQQPNALAPTGSSGQHFQQHLVASNQRRSQESSLFDARIPQYLAALGANSRRLSGQAKPAEQAQTTTQAPSSSTAAPTAPPTTTTASGPSSAPAANSQEASRVGSEDITEQPNNEESAINRLSSASSSSDSTGSGSSNKVANSAESVSLEPAGSQFDSMESQDNKAEASNHKPTIVMPEEAFANQDQSGPARDEEAGGGSDKPSVQGNEEQPAPPADSVGSAGAPQASDSSLKTVEVEIPANPEQDQIRPFVKQQNSFGATIEDEPLGPSNNFAKQPESSPIQPREPQHSNSGAKRERNDENLSIESMMGTGRHRFGARQSQSPSSVQQQQPANHQPAADQSAAMANAKETSSIVNSNDKILINRSDDSASLTELMFSSGSPSANSNNESPAKPEDASAIASASDENSGIPYLDPSLAASGAGNNKIKPVVGTEELASGPLQIEDRIGSQAQGQESLEEALKRLQQQIPQQAAQQGPLPADSKPEERADGAPNSQQAQQSQKAESLKEASPSERSDSQANQMKKLTGSQQQAGPKSDQMQMQLQQAKQSVASSGPSQPFPNVLGQAKVIPDPASSLLTRGASMVAQASGEGAPSVSLPAGKQQQVADAQKPVAQITNIPMGFPQQQAVQSMPTLQQHLQHIAFIQQQQQQQQQIKLQQQQQQVPSTSTTQKPGVRSRFNLLSPQAALHAVASRFLPKSTQAPSQPQQQLPLVVQQMPHLLGSIKASAEQQQQQQLLALQQTNQQPQFAQAGRFQIQAVQPQQAQPAKGLFSRLTSKQHPLVRSRRSAIMPNGNKGSGEVGMTKTFMVVTNMDLAFSPNFTGERELPEILEGRRLLMARDDTEAEVIYGVCIPIVSLTFVLTCVFWLIVFVVSFCIYMLITSRKQQLQATSINEKH